MNTQEAVEKVFDIVDTVCARSPTLPGYVDFASEAIDRLPDHELHALVQHTKATCQCIEPQPPWCVALIALALERVVESRSWLHYFAAMQFAKRKKIDAFNN